MDVAVLGLGEAGRVYAEGLQSRGATVRGYDPAFAGGSIAIADVAPSLEAAVEKADLVLSLVGASAAEVVASQAIMAMAAGGVLADLNTTAPALMAGLADRAAASGVLFVDVAIMAPVPRAGIDTQLLASGSGAAWMAERFRELSIPLEDVGPDAGTAAGLKLLRSVFMKGLAGLVFESMTAAETAGSADWMRGQIAAEFGDGGHDLVERLMSGTRTHAVRRVKEMQDAGAYLDSLGTPAWMTEATTRWLQQLAAPRP